MNIKINHPLQQMLLLYSNMVISVGDEHTTSTLNQTGHVGYCGTLYQINIPFRRTHPNIIAKGVTRLGSYWCQSGYMLCCVLIEQLAYQPQATTPQCCVMI